MLKKAVLEQSTLIDPRTNLDIKVSTTARIKYRKYYSGQESIGSGEFGRTNYSHLSNQELNDIIAQDFAASADGAAHMFISKSSNIETKKREWIEIRKVKVSRPFNVFFSVIRGSSIDIINVSTRWKIPRKARKPIRNTKES